MMTMVVKTRRKPNVRCVSGLERAKECKCTGIK